MSPALSLSWNSFRFSRGQEIVDEAKGLGFDRVELNFSLTPQVVEDILALSGQGKIKVTSLHNFCPFPDGFTREQALPDCYSLAAEDEAERRQAVRWTRQTIDYCQRFRARAVVLHAGKVNMADETRTLLKLRFSAEPGRRRQYELLRAKMQRDRKARAKLHLEQVKKSLEELSRYAQDRGVALGLENRFYFSEIPNFFEIEGLLSHFAPADIFYWHDTGHARIMEILGFVPSAGDFLRCYGERLLGLHLHDVRGHKDHLAPFTGELDFDEIKPYAREGVIKIIEAHHPATSEEVARARERIESWR
ncbi:MAG: sugar phosphate isomerase/epimerase family protein [Candidatus Omnitrophota bacterium]